MPPNAVSAAPSGIADRPLDEAKRVLGLTQAQLARVIGTTPRTVSRWRSRSAQHVEPSASAGRKLREIERLAFLLESDLGRREGAEWLHRPNAALRGRAPIDVMLDGNYATVLGLVLSLGQGGLY
jgi:transcriptional regulator with XRE-family HTH domain